jgi:PAS domain S-box-containing protein
VHSPDVQPDPKTLGIPRFALRFRKASQIISLLVAALGFVVLCGWAFSVPALTYIRPSWQSMKVNTALSFLCLGAGLWLAQDDKWQRSRRVLGFFVVIIAGLTLAEYAFHISLGIDQLLFRDTRTPSLSAYPGRMAIATATCFLLLGLAVTLLGTKKAIALQRSLVAVSFALSLVALCGYLYGVHSLYSITAYSTVAIHTAAGFLAACLAYFFARPDEGIVSIAASETNSGLLLRTVVPAIIVVPIVIGWLRLAGQRANLYDTAFGTVLLVLGSIGCLTALTVLVARSINRLERERSSTEQTIRESENRFHLVADTAPALIWMSGTDKLCNYFNKPWLDFTGRSMEEELGSGWAEGVHPDDLQRCLDTYTQSFDRREKFRMEYRLRHHDGEYRWILDIGVPRLNQDRSFAGYIGIGIDVTDRKKAINREHQVLGMLDLVTAQMAAAVTRCSRDFRYLWANQAYADWLQRPVNEIVGQQITDVLGMEAFEALLPYFKRVLTGENIHYEEEVNFCGIGKRWISATYTPTLDADGRTNGWVAVVHDITERKRTVDARLRLAAVVESSEDAVISKNLDGVITTWNAGAEHIFGYTEEEVVGQPITILIPPELRGEENRILEKLRAGESIKHYETIRVTKADRKLFVSLSISPLKDSTGRIVGGSKIARDVTDRKLAEDALRESEERFRLVANAAPVMIWMSGLDKQPTYFNQLWLDFTGLSETDLQNGLAGIVHPDDYPQCHEVYCRGFDQRQPFTKECRLRRHDGKYRWILDIGVPRFHKDGSFAGYIGSCIDVTDQKLAEQARSDMTRKLVEAQEQERARIARELHDDINQRLAMLALELEQLKENPSEIENRVQELRKQTIDISNDVQAISHDLHSSQLEYLGAVAGMKSWCKEFGKRQRMEIDCRHDVRGTLPPEIGLCLFRVLQEALHNAAKHSGVKRIEVELHEDSGEIHLIVRDLGRGFDVEAVKQSKGLGLTSMRERVRLVNGTILIRSTPQRGTTIQVGVPLPSEQDSRPGSGVIIGNQQTTITRSITGSQTSLTGNPRAG